jgi:hypothetical protein
MPQKELVEAIGACPPGGVMIAAERGIIEL